jgi:acetylornithine deacetylase/succinyl-diaminopimelate desuccinylase-like protein
MFAPTGRQQGLLDTVLRNAATWVEAQKVPGLKLEVVRLEGRTPVLFFEVEGTAEGQRRSPTVLMYGHLDKQPEFEGWRSDLGPGRPSTRTASSTAVAAPTTAMRSTPAWRRAGAQAPERAHPRIVGIIETCEESGSRDLLPYVDACARAWAMWAW